MQGLNFFKPIGQGQEVLTGTNPAFLADLQAKQQRLALNNAMIAKMAQSVKDTPIASRSTRIGQGLLQGLYMAMARRDMKDIDNLKKADADARNQAEAWKKDYLTTELDRASNPIFVNGTADEMAKARAGYNLIQNHQMQGLENNPYAMQFRNNRLVEQVQQAMNEQNALKTNALNRANMQLKSDLVQEQNNQKYENSLALQQDRQANQQNLLEQKQASKLNRFGMMPRGEARSLATLTKGFAPTAADYMQKKQDFEDLEFTKGKLQAFMARNPELANQSHLGAKLAGIKNNLLTLIKDDPKARDYIMNRNTASQFENRAVLQQIKDLTGVQTDEDAARIGRAILGDYGASFPSIMDAIEYAYGRQKDDLDELRNRISNYITTTDAYKHDDYYTALDNAFGGIPEFRKAIDEKVAAIKQAVQEGQITPQQGQAAVTQVVEQGANIPTQATQLDWRAVGGGGGGQPQVIDFNTL